MRTYVNVLVNATVIGGLAFALTQMDSEATGTPPTPSVSYGQRLIDAHCADADGAIPGHVVASRPSDVAARYYGPRVARLALEQQFNGTDHGLKIYAFCK